MANYDSDKFYHFYLNADRTNLTAANIVQGVNGTMDIETGPDGARWDIEGGGYQDGILKRITGPGTPAPSPTSSGANPTRTPAPGVLPPPVPLPGSGIATFPETGKSVRGLFLEYWRQHGGLPQQGYPISEVIGEVSELDRMPYTVQYFERAVFEYHPHNAPPFNVLLSQLGTFHYKLKYPPPSGAPNQKPNTSEGSIYFRETNKRIGGRFLEYWQQHGGLMQQGYPISDEFVEKSELDGKEYLVQYFERAVFEHHPENRPPYDVLLSHLGTLQFKQKHSK
jgi:hypothetical protein